MGQIPRSIERISSKLLYFSVNNNRDYDSDHCPTLVVHIEKSIWCVCLCICTKFISFELNDLLLRYLGCSFFLTLSTGCVNKKIPSFKVKVTGQSSCRMKKDVAKLIGATSSGGFLATTVKWAT